jgi:bacterioferritin-associated ferredoxin
MYVCLCKGITESDVRAAGLSGCSTARQIIAQFGLKEHGCCGRCAKSICELVSLAESPHDCPLQKSTASR